MDGLKALPDSPSKAFAALGNAVNSNVVEKVARALLAVQPQLEVKKDRSRVEEVAA